MLAPFLEKKASEAGVQISRVNEIDELNNEIAVIGTFYKEIKNKISFLKVIESPEYNELYPEPDSLEGTDKDTLFIEDLSGRRQVDVSGCQIDLQGFSG